MGVPAFFRWLTRKYPSVVVHCVEQKAIDINGVRIPTNASEPNPNGMEFDNLYLDMNGIIHPCTHPEDRPAPRNETEMMIAIFDCIDRMFNIVRPRKVLYMAIDGVAPRAKMNQQRSRRFRASKETVEKMNEINRIRAELLLRGAALPVEKEKVEHFDSNCITPGTPFMARLSDCLHYYIHERLMNDAGWRDIKVILSDANVPGEGEHKIMDFIRKQRAQPDHDPNTQHCLCGADADLIMLGLATHEPNFTIIREEFKPNKPRPCEICGQIGHEMKDCIGGKNSATDDVEKVYAETDYIFVRLCVLKEYLARELAMPNLPFKYDFDRVLDDWVFMCFFVGNDFLPHLPSLEIRENAIDRLVRLYKDCVYKTGGYLTDSGNVNLERVQLILSELGKVEDDIFKMRQQKELQFKARDKAKRRSGGFNQYKPNWNLVKNTQFAPVPLGQAAQQSLKNVRQDAYAIRKAGMHSSASSSSSALNSLLTPTDDDSASSRGQKRKFDDDNDNKQASGSKSDDEDDDQSHDEVRLWEDGCKDRYYESKFDVGPDNLDFRYSVALQYVRGLCWVLRYYYQGCASWKWYFPYHYAPFASDFVNISSLSTEFETDTKPFKPLEQLMGVFPAASSKHVPQPWAHLMSNIDSTIIDFYPEDFKIDLNGKKYAWQGVALLPFVDETRLFKALAPYYKDLSAIEIKRNIRGDDRLYLGAKHTDYNLLNELYKMDVSKEAETVITIDGMQGRVLLAEECIESGGYLASPVAGLTAIQGNTVCCVRFRDPKYNLGFIFEARKLNGAIDPPKVLKPNDLNAQDNRNWRTQIGMVPAQNRATMSHSGHRMLNFHSSSNHHQQQQYSNVPPPNNDHHRRGDNMHRGGYNQSRGYSSYNNPHHHQQQQQQGSGYQQQNNYNNNRNRYNPYNNNNNNRGQQSGGYNRRYGGNNNQSAEQQQESRRRAPGPYSDGYEPSNNNNNNNNRYHNYGR